MRYLYILKIKPLSVESFANIFSHSSGCHCFSDDFLCCERLLGIFLVVQWLRLGTFTAVGAGLNPGLGTKVLHAAWCGLKTKQNRGLFCDFPGGPAAKTSHFQCRGTGFNSLSGN